MNILNSLGVKNGEIIHIDELQESERGLNCECYCAECGKPLVARMGIKNTWHFAHKSETSCNFGVNKIGGESAIHKLAKKIILENKYLKCGNNITYNFKNIIDEYSENGTILDLLGITEEGEEIGIEIFYKHRVNADKIKKLKSRYKKVVEIDIPAVVEETQESFKNKVLQGYRRYWLVNNEFDIERMCKKQKELEEREMYLNQKAKDINRGYESKRIELAERKRAIDRYLKEQQNKINEQNSTIKREKEYIEPYKDIIDMEKELKIKEAMLKMVSSKIEDLKAESAERKQKLIDLQAELSKKAEYLNTAYARIERKYGKIKEFDKFEEVVSTYAIGRHAMEGWISYNRIDMKKITGGKVEDVEIKINYKEDLFESVAK